MTKQPTKQPVYVPSAQKRFSKTFMLCVGGLILLIVIGWIVIVGRYVTVLITQTPASFSAVKTFISEVGEETRSTREAISTQRSTVPSYFQTPYANEEE